MKNRLEIAKRLLRDDGVIFVQCDDNEQAYLKVLMDEIFGRDNFISCITCKVKSAGGLTTDTEMLFNCSEYIQVYSKNFNKLTFNGLKIEKEVVNSFTKTAKQYNQRIVNIDFNKKKFICEKDGIKYYKISQEHFKFENLPLKKMKEIDYYNEVDNIFRLTALSGGIGKKLKSHIKDFTNLSDLFIYEYTPTKGRDAFVNTQYLLYKNQTLTKLKI